MSEPVSRATLALIAVMPPILAAKTWAQLEDEMLLDLDVMDCSPALSERDPLRVATAGRLAEAGICNVRKTIGADGVEVARVTRVFPIRKAL